MYKIVGADGKVYGPVTLDQLRQWIAEGRASLQSQVLPDGGTQWVTIADLPELGGGLPPIPGQEAPVMSAPGVVSAGAEKIQDPAIGLICVAVFGFLAHLAILIIRLSGHTLRRTFTSSHAHFDFNANSRGTLLLSVIALLACAFVFVAALRMRKLKSHRLAVMASIVAMIPCVGPCCVIGLPVGIWALIVLLKPEVKSAFH